MKITITQEFDNVEDALAFLQPTRITSVVIDEKVDVKALRAADAEVREAISQRETEQRTRKPRNDAGKPRGAYKPRGTTTGEPAASEPGVVGKDSAVPQQPAAPATPTRTAAPSSAEAQAQKAQRQEQPASAAAAPGKAPTEAEARAALSRINETKGLAMEACIKHLNKFGVEQFSKLDPARYAEFIATADVLVAEHKAGK